jgi:hypothetical protein
MGESGVKNGVTSFMDDPKGDLWKKLGFFFIYGCPKFLFQISITFLKINFCINFEKKNILGFRLGKLPDSLKTW